MKFCGDTLLNLHAFSIRVTMLCGKELIWLASNGFINWVFFEPRVLESEDDLVGRVFSGCLLQPPAQSRADVSVRLCDRK